jgi:hypothetical protein
MTEHNKILCWLGDLWPQWISSEDLTKVETPYGKLTARGSRSARDLAEDGKLERKYEGKKNYAYYRLKKETQATLC